MVVLVPVPVAVAPPGVLIKVHVPVAGKLFNTTLPVGTTHVGCVLVPTLGAEGIEATVAEIAVLVPVVQPFAVAST
jgi:hypothetical protein